MSTVKLGIIGCGVIGSHHATAATESKLVDLAAVADVREDAVKAMAEKFKVPKTYASGNELLDDDGIEAVVLAMPTCHRFDLAMRAFAKGKHVLTEKPVAMNSGDVRKMIKARGDLVAACCSSRNRHTESAKVITDFIASGGIGPLRLIHCRALIQAGPMPDTPRPAWRLKKELNGGGILVNWGCYDLDYLLGITGWTLKPKTVLAQTWTIPPQLESHVAPNSDAETYFAALIRCEDGAMISFERGEYMPVHTEQSWQIIGTKGSLTMQMTPGKNKKVIHDDTTAEQGLVPKVLWEGDDVHNAGRGGLLDVFASAILKGGEPATTLEKALVVQQITDAIYASAESGKAVEIE
ncbi:MAG: Gfo/Idh/MocA family oxidoreductase [Planctomycetota bacterium]